MSLIVWGKFGSFGRGLRHPMGELLNHEHVLPQGNLYRRHREQPRVELSELLARVTHDVVEIHARKSSMPLRDVDLEVLVTDGTEDPAAVMEYHVTPAVVFAKQKERGLIDTICDAVIGYLVECPSQAGGGREQIGDV